jgi:hypothetical protein
MRQIAQGAPHTLAQSALEEGPIRVSGLGPCKPDFSKC